MAGQRWSATNAGAASAATAPHPTARQAGATAARVSTGVAKGVGGFLRPFRRVGGILFLEITGAFFFLFVILFGNWAWKLRTSYAQGPDHGKFLVFCAMTALFFYLSLSSFWRARRK
jgi:hypothetical protein